MAEILQFPTNKIKNNIPSNIDRNQNQIQNDPEFTKLMEQFNKNDAIQKAALALAQPKTQNNINPTDIPIKTDPNGNVYLTLVFNQLAWQELQLISKKIDGGDIVKTIGESIATREVVVTNRFYAKNDNFFIRIVNKYLPINNLIAISILMFFVNMFSGWIETDIMFNVSMVIICLALLISHIYNNILYDPVKFIKNN